MFPGIGALPEPATESHVVNRETLVAPCRLKTQRKRVTRVGSLSPCRGSPVFPIAPMVTVVVTVGARGMSSVRYRTRLGDLKNKQSTHTVATSVPGRRVRVSSVLHNGGLPGGWRVASTSGSVSAGPYHIHRGRAPLCVDCLFLRSQSRVPYRTELIPRAPKWRRTRTPHP